MLLILHASFLAIKFLLSSLFDVLFREEIKPSYTVYQEIVIPSLK